MLGLSELGVDVERQMLRGERFSDVEALINASDLSDDEKSALWLLAWSYVDHRAQRREARAHIDVLAGGRRRQPPSERLSFHVIDGGSAVEEARVDRSLPAHADRQAAARGVKSPEVV
jgi:hypothetical protein